EDKWNCVVPQGDVNALANRIVQISEQKPLSKEDCRKRAELISDKHKQVAVYFELYKRLLSQ
ncbi:MAG: hypothetical protein N4A74_01225, partial [Carboxylicivirga sp.]|nr:hypothetical protein [Carboxylicivirga sp.]